MTLRLRFAPSPTGYMHVGHLRAALPNALFAMANKATLILRFEDTDLERNKTDSETAFLEDLAWLGFSFNEGPHLGGPFGPYRTIERMERGDYAKAVQQLMDAGRAYECYCTPEELELMKKVQVTKGEAPRYDNRHRNLSDAEKAQFKAEGRKCVIRFKLNDGDIKWNDLIRGEAHFKAENLGGDPVIVRSNGIPLFTFAGAVDDIAMQITHVVRGEDHITNAAVQVQLHEALGNKNPPHFVHTPMMLDKDGHKMSKRLGALTIRQLREQGILANALITYMTSMGMSEAPAPTSTLQSLAEGYSFDQIGKSPVRFDEEAMALANAHAIHQMEWDAAKTHGGHFMPASVPADKQAILWHAVRDTLTTFADLPKAAEAALTEPQTINVTADDKPLLEAALASIPAEPYSREVWKAWTQALQASTGRKGKQLFMPLRQALTGHDHGADMGNLMPLWTPQTLKTRLTNALQKCC